MDTGAFMTPWRPLGNPRVGRVVTGIAVALTVGVFLLQALPSSAAWLARLDGAWHRRVVEAETPFWIALASFLQIAGSAWVTVPLRLIVAGVLWAKKLRARFGLWIAAAVSTEALALLLKASYGKARPADGLSPVINTAFPSGHTAAAASLAFSALLVLFLPGPARRRFLPLALLWAVGMAWSRTYLRDHWLSDTVAGFLLGLSCVLVTAVIVQARMPRRV